MTELDLVAASLKIQLISRRLWITGWMNFLLPRPPSISKIWSFEGWCDTVHVCQLKCATGPLSGMLNALTSMHVSVSRAVHAIKLTSGQMCKCPDDICTIFVILFCVHAYVFNGIG